MKILKPCRCGEIANLMVSEWWVKKNFEWPEIDINWVECRNKVDEILAKEAELANISQLIGEENLPEDQQLTLYVANIIKKGFLIQNAFDEVDRYTDPTKLLGMIKIILLLYKEALDMLKAGILLEDIKQMEIINVIFRMGISIPNENFEKIENIKDTLVEEMNKLRIYYGV